MQLQEANVFQNRSANYQVGGDVDQFNTKPAIDAHLVCLHHLFEKQVDRGPDRLALVCGERNWSYEDLEVEANLLCLFLREKGVGPGHYVGLTLDRSEWPIVSILAILKAGGAYVPLEPGLPDERIRRISETADLSFVLTGKAHQERLAGLSAGELLCLEDFRRWRHGRPAPDRLSPARIGLKESDPCYVLFTSGSTGQPKGVVAEHRNVVHFVEAFNRVCSTTSHDRVFQGFSLGFDGSVEEIWMAFSNGAALICGEVDTPRFGDDFARVLNAHKITFLSTVPTLLSTIGHDVPSLRQLVVSGEVCPGHLVDQWAVPGRTMLNVYGPTEATVNSTARVLVPGEPVTIGRPLNGYQLFILGTDQQPVAKGEKGELFIAGPSISRGYLRAPEQTKASFVERDVDRVFLNQAVDRQIARQCTNLTSAADDLSLGETREERIRLRLYRTGDLVRLNEKGDLEFFGRVDNQVKIRGFRVELSEIEAALTDLECISAATVALYGKDGVDVLAAHVLAANGQKEIDRDHVLKALRDRLPVYMVPQYLEVVESFPRLASGKIDRKSLIQPVTPLQSKQADDSWDFEGEEERLAGVWSSVLGCGAVGPDQDFFVDLGGHSLLAARLVTEIREEFSLSVPISDVYRYPTVRRLGQHMLELAESTEAAQSEENAVSDTVAVRAQPKWTTLTGQVIYLLAILPLLFLPTVLLLPTAMSALRMETSLVSFAALAIGLGLGLWMVLILTAIAAKWAIIGRYKPGGYPMWGGYYLRWWIVSRLQHLSGLGAFNGTPLAPVLWRAMGAKVGKGCVLNSAQVYAWDCIEIGDDVSIGSDTQLAGLRVENGRMLVGRISIGNRCFVGAHSVIGNDARMGDDCLLGDQSLLPDGVTLADGGAYRGSPAVPDAVLVPTGKPLRAPAIKLFGFGALQIGLGVLVTLVCLLPLAAFGALLGVLAINTSVMFWLPALIVGVPVAMIAFCLWLALCKRWVRPCAHEETVPVYSRAYLEHWLAGVVMEVAKTAGMSVFTTLYLPAWMRLMGARLGANVEMSTVWTIDPDLVSAGDGVFFADGAMLASHRIHLGRCMIAPISVGNRSFVGNSAILSAGDRVGDDCLLGVLSSPPEQGQAIGDGTDWLGSPSFQLPRRQKVTCFDDSKTFRPDRRTYLHRAMIDALRVVLPGYIIGLTGIAGVLVVSAVYAHYGVWGAYTAIPLMAWLVLAAVLASVIGLKWAIMRRFQPTVQPLWSPYIWWNELVNGLYESLMGPVVANLYGTPFAAMLLRMLGCKIGKHCFIETNLFSEFDLVEIGDGVALNSGVVIQNHLFEDRIMKSAKLVIANDCSVGNMSVVLYDTHMDEGAVLKPMSLLMKGERKPRHTCWQGIPTREVTK